MKLKIGSLILADSALDGVTQSMRSSKGALELRASSTELRGVRYARNRSRAWGLGFSFEVEVVRQFSSYTAAERFTLRHMASLAAGAEGRLVYDNYLGDVFGYDNAALERVEISSEIGVTTVFVYAFRCGKPIVEFELGVSVGGVAVSVGGVVPTIKY